MTLSVKDGDRVITGSGRRGVVVGTDPNFPLHALIQFDDDARSLLILKQCLNLDTEPVKVKSTKAKQVQSA